MALATWAVALDLDASGSFVTDITPYVHRYANLSRQGLGRARDLDAAGQVGLTVTVDNADGRFSPKNSGGAYFDNLHPSIPIRVRVTWNSTTYDYFKGVVTAISVRPKGEESLAHLTCADLMYVLARTDTRLPLMEGKRTGIIIHRLLDYAEEGEHVDNPRFKDDLSGYSALGAGTTITRVTDSDVLEGNAALEAVSASGLVKGWTYAIPHAADSEFANRKVTAAVYVWAPLDADVGETFTLRLRDNAANRGTSTIALSREPQRVEVTATFGGGTTDFFIDGYMNTGSTVRTGAVHAVFSGRAFGRAVDAGVASIERVTYNRTPALDAIQEVRDNELGGLFYVNRAGNAVFEARDHRWQSDHLTSQTTVDEVFRNLEYTEDLADRVSEVVLDFPRWEVGEADTVVFSLAPLPRSIAPNGTLTIEADYGGGLVRGTTVPVASTDYLFNANPDGSGANETANVTLAFEDFGGGARAVFTNTVARSVYLTLFQIRGTPVREASDRSPVRVTPTTGPPFKNVLNYGYRLQASEAHVQAYADYLVARYGDDQQPRVEMTLAEPFPDAPTTGLMAAILGREISDRVTIRNDDLPWAAEINEDFYIDGIDIEIGAQEIVATWRLSPVDASMMIWDSSSWDSADVWAP